MKTNPKVQSEASPVSSIVANVFANVGVMPARKVQEAEAKKWPRFNVPNALVLKVAKRAKRPLVTKMEIARLKAAEQEYVRLEAYRDQHSWDAARAAFRAQRPDCVTRVQSEPVCSKPDDREFWSFQDWEEDYKSKRSAAKTRLYEVCWNLSDLHRAVQSRIAQCAFEEANLIEASERLVAESFGVEFEPSNVLKMLRALSLQVEPTSLGFAPPRMFLQFVGIQDIFDPAVSAADDEPTAA